MIGRISNRKYTRPALEFWLGKLALEWEKEFSAATLARGRKLYRRGDIKAVELGNEDAIVHGKVDDFEGYVVLEWDGRQLQVRASTVDQAIAQALAVAGMYEVEELVGDEVAPLAPDGTATVPADVQNAPAAAQPPLAAGEPAHPPEPGDDTHETRKLCLQFSTTLKGLQFAVLWQNEYNQYVPALGEDAAPAEDMTHPEREQLIRLANFARRSGFHFSIPHNLYVLDELERAPGFVRHELPNWKKYFLVDADDDVDALRHGIQEVDVIARADAQAEDGFDLQWDMQLGTGLLSEEEGRCLTRRGRSPSILHGRGLVRLKDNEADVLADWNDTMGDHPNATMPRYMLLSLFGQSALKVILTPELRTWRDALFHPQAHFAESHEQLATLRAYQYFGVQWLAHICNSGCHALLADEMGLGKTLQVLTLLATRPVAGKPSLIVCPASVVPVWLGEIARFYPALETSVVNKANYFGQPNTCQSSQQPAASNQEKKSRRNASGPCHKPSHPAAAHNDQRVWICSYTQLRQHKAILHQTEFGYAVLDEAQFIKNPEAKVTIACMQLKAQHRIAMTGTPLENRFLDVWTLFRFLMPGLLGGRRKFERQLAEDPFNTMANVRKQIAPFVLRRTKAEVAQDLPKKIHNNLVCPLTDMQRIEYQRLTQQGITEFGQDLTQLPASQTVNFLSLLTRLRQCCCDPALLPWVDADWQHSGKIIVLMDKLAEVIANQHKVVIFSQFVTLLNRVALAIQEKFPDTACYRLTGHTQDRKTPVDAFQKQAGSGIFLVSLRAGGTGITLNTADYVFLLDPWWNPAVEAQAIDRVHRIGQKRTVFVYSMITQGTLETRIQKLKTHKRELFDQAVGEFASSSEFKHYFHSLSELIALRSLET